MVDPVSLVAWASDELGLPVSPFLPESGPQMERAQVFAIGLEVHHDTDRVDVSLFERHQGGRTWSWPGVQGCELELASVDVVEYDVTHDVTYDVTHDVTDRWRRAGVFHSVAAGEPPASLAAFGTPSLVAHLTGRAGQVRFLVPVPDREAHRDLCSALTDAGMSPIQVARFAASAPLVVGPDSLRLGLEFLPETGRLGPRLGLEVCIDPRLADCSAVLESMQVSPEAIASMVDLAERVPRSRVMRRRSLLAPELPIPDIVQGIGFHHFSLTWALDDQIPPRLKSYLMVQAEPEPPVGAVRDRHVLVEGRSWPEQLRWARDQLPPSVELPGWDSVLARWRAAVDSTASARFERRLERDGLTVQTAAAAFALPHLAIRDPQWWDAYQRMITALEDVGGAAGGEHSLDADAWLASIEAAMPEVATALPYSHLFWPIVVAATARLEAEMGAPLVDGVRSDLQVALLGRICGTSAPALTEQFWADVPLGRRILAQSGPEPIDPPRQRYADFCRRQQAEGLSPLLTEFPVLGGLLAIMIDQWHRRSVELLRRVRGDRQLLEQRLGVPQDQPLTGVSVTAGDRHNDGDAVALLQFGDHRVVYKPRSVALEELYTKVADAISADDAADPLLAPTAVPLSDEVGDYGYVAFVTGRACDPELLPRFYRNAGRLLALLHVLSANDCHHENLIASGDQLILIDAETLLVSQPSPATLPTTDPDASEGADAWSVLHVGMLPCWLWLDGRQRAVDISALGTAPGGEPTTFRGWRTVNTDAMVRAEMTATPQHPTSLPTPPGVAAPVAAHVDELVDGFTQAYRVLAEGRSSWLADLLDSVAGSSNRAVLRPTYVYATLLGQLIEPDALRTMAGQAAVLERLTRAFLDDDAEQMWELVRAEQEAMARLDVPFFQWPLTGGGTTWLGGSLQDWPDHDQMAGIKARLEQLGDDDLRRQVALIRASVEVSGFRMVPASVPAQRSVTEQDRASIAGLSRRCFDALEQARFDARGEATWMGMTLLPDGERANVQAIGTGLYDGRLGLAVGFQAFAQTVPVAAETSLATSRAALAPVVSLLSEPETVLRLLLGTGSGLSGAGGWLRGLIYLAETAPDGLDLQQPIGTVIDGLSCDWLRQDGRLDMMAGPAGLVGPLVRVLEDPDRWGVRKDHVRALIVASAEALLARQEGASGGWVAFRGAPPLSGLAHGASGVSLALAEAGVALGDESFVAAAARGLRYESTLFDDDAGNWLDLRPPLPGSGGPPEQDRPARGFMMGWCAGAPGIALARWRMLQLLGGHQDAPEWHEQMNRAAETTAAAPVSSRDHLCCGNMGRVAILRTVAREVPAVAAESAANQIADAVVAAADAGLPRSSLGEEIPDLPMPAFFTGLSGIGAALAGGGDWTPRLLL